MDDFSVVWDSFDSCLTHLIKVLERCVETNFILNWEKCHFMVKEVIVLGHKIFVKGIQVDQAKVEVITNLPSPISVKGVQVFLVMSGFIGASLKIFRILLTICANFLKRRQNLSLIVIV